MNKATSEEIKLRIVNESEYDSTQWSNNFVEVSLHSTYNSFIELLQKSEIINPTKNYLIFLRDIRDNKVDNLSVDINSFNMIKERVINQMFNNEQYFVIQEIISQTSQNKNSESKT